MGDTMQEFFVTFGQRYAQEPHPVLADAHPDGWLVIEAESWDEARAAVATALGTSWSNLYEKTDFMQDAARLYPRGEIARISPSEKSDGE
jgi:hypothetical protein